MSSTVLARPLRWLGAGALLCAVLAVGPAYAQDGGLAAVSGVQVTATSATEAVARIAVTPVGGAMPTYSAFRATGPDRVILDIANARLADGSSVAGGGGLVKSVESSTFNDGTANLRLTFALTGAATPTVAADGNTIVLTITKGASDDPLGSALGQNEPVSTRLSSYTEHDLSGPALDSVDFQQQEKTSRVILQLQGVEPSVSQTNATLLVVDLPKAQIPSHIVRELDTSRFFSAVDAIHVRPTRSGARVEIALRESTEYSVSRDGNLLYVDLKIPADILAQRDAGVSLATDVAPSTPQTNGGEGLHNASGSEVLIGASGKTSNPQAAFGTGAGTGAGGALSWAQEAPGMAGVRFVGRRMTIDLQEADIHTVLRFIGDVAGVNIVASDGVQGKITVHLVDVPWDQALAAVLQAKGLGAQRFGDILRVAPLEVIKAEQQTQLEATKAKADLEELQTYVAPLNYAQADAVATQLKNVISSRGTVTVDATSNQIIVKDTAGVIASIRELLRTLDKENRQVFIEARFVEASSNFEHALGIEWGSDVDASAATGYPTGLFFPNSVGVTGGMALDTKRSENFYGSGADSLLVDLGATSSTGAISFALGSIPGLIDLNARLSALETEGWGKIVSNPRVTALDNEEASVTQGERIPYLSTSNGGTSVQFVNAELELTVTPHITTSDTVFLDIKISNNRPDTSLTVNGQPAISTKEIKTRVLVPDGDTTVLGGVYATTDEWSQERVPGLSQIPLIGYLFKNSLRRKSQNEMLVFITPTIQPAIAGS